MINAIIFDLDMTLLDTLEATTYGANLLAAEYGLPEKTQDDILAAAYLPTAEFWKKIFGEFRPEWTDYLVTKVIPEIVKNTKLYPQGEEILTAAKAKGILLAVASNRNKPWKDLADLGLAKFFDTVVGSADVPNPKPSPDMLFAILAQLGVDAQTSLYIGDTPVDMNCARAAAVQGLGLTQSGSTQEALYYAGATYVRPSLAESRDILGC
jgi:phosphoglycolate phosphatase